MIETVFKYCDRYGLDILQNLELKVTPPNEFNDPFEFRPQVICSNSNRKFKITLRNDQDERAAFAEQKKAGFKGTARQFRRELRKARPALVAEFAKNLPELNSKLQENYPDRASEEHGVLCLSTRSDSLVMWGHYCDKYRGMVIELDASWPLFQGRKGLHRVEYRRERVVWDTVWPSGGAKETKLVEKLVFGKNDEWSYEHEVRQLFTLAGLPSRRLRSGIVGYFLPIPAEIVLSVTLSMRCPEVLCTNVRKALSGPHLSHVQLRRAVLHDSKFALKVDGDGRYNRA